MSIIRAGKDMDAAADTESTGVRIHSHRPGQALQQPENRKDIKTFTFRNRFSRAEKCYVTVNPGSSMNVEGNTKKEKEQKESSCSKYLCHIICGGGHCYPALIVSNIRKENESDDYIHRKLWIKNRTIMSRQCSYVTSPIYDDAVKIFEELRRLFRTAFPI